VYGFGFLDRLHKMLRVFQISAYLAVSMFKGNDSGKSFGSSYIDLTLGSVLEVKL
jgi:hypothetical protein